MNHPTSDRRPLRPSAPTPRPFAAFMHRAWGEAGPDAAGFAGANEESIAEIASPSVYEQSIAGPDRHMFLAWDHKRVVDSLPPGWWT
jgi:hypothetical protein